MPEPFVLAGWLKHLHAFMRATGTPLAEILVSGRPTTKTTQENGPGATLDRRLITLG